MALLALALDNPPPADGIAPDLNELLAWQQGRVAQPRADEIKSHVARDPEIYALWREARAMLASQLPKQQPKRERLQWPDWLIFPDWLAQGGLPIAITAALLVAIGLPQLEHSSALSSQIDEDYQSLAPMALSSAQWNAGFDQQEKALMPPKSGNPNLSDLKLPINVGIRQGLLDLTSTGKLNSSWSGLLKFYPPLQASCPDGQNCQTKFAVLKEFGRWMALNRLQCLDNTATVQLKPDEKISRFIEATAPHQDLAEFRRLLEQWQSDIQHNPGQFCEKIATGLKQLNN